ncbi:hypothetical protein GX48_00529 [Paracoccidioides brasiliensis]|nr:hypothetical protein GX48_00529 [Paracoccidioides brasiliensis]
MDDKAKVYNSRIESDAAPEAQPKTASKVEKDSHGLTLTERVEQLEDVSERPDFTISAIDCEYNVHSRIICARSRFFEKAVNGNFAESRSKRIHLPEEEMDSLELLISILYGFEISYFVELWTEAQDDSNGSTDGIDKSESRIATPKHSLMENNKCPDVPRQSAGLRLLRFYALSWAKETVLIWTKTNVHRGSIIEVIRDIYRCESGNYTELMDGISAIIMDNVDILVDHDGFYDVVAENGELGAELLRYVILTNKIVMSAMCIHSSLEKLHNIGGQKLVYEAARLKLKIHHRLEKFPGLSSRKTGSE